MTEDKTVEALENEDSQETEADLELINDDTSFEDEASDETEEKAEEDESANESTEEESESDEGETQKEDTKEEDTTSEAERKKHNAEMAQKRIAERQAREEQKRKQQEEYLSGAKDETDLALREVRLEAYLGKVERNNDKLESGIERAVADIDLFRTGSPEIKEELARSLEDFEQMYVMRDANGDPADVKGDVYQFLQAKADSIRRLTSVGARNQTRASANTKARTDAVPTRAPKEGKKDDVLDGFDEEASRW